MEYNEVIHETSLFFVDNVLLTLNGQSFQHSIYS